MMRKLSWTQNEILARFIRAENLRYSQARPEGIADDLYNYHLQFLVKKNYLEKMEDGYQLTKQGKQYVAQLDVWGMLKKKFKVSVIVWVIRKGKKGSLEILYQERKRQPFYGDHAAIAGKILPGEKIVDAARRKLKEEAGLNGDFKFLGVVRTIRLDPRGEVLEDALYHICLCENAKGRLIEENDFGKQYWIDICEASKLELKNKGYGRESYELLKNLRKVIKQEKTFYYEEITTLKKY